MVDLRKILRKNQVDRGNIVVSLYYYGINDGRRSDCTSRAIIPTGTLNKSSINCLSSILGKINLLRDGCRVRSRFQLHQRHWLLTVAIAFSPDGKTLFTSGYEKIVKHWDFETGNCLQTLTPARPDEGMIITEAIGLAEADVATLKALEALEVN
ncbi:MAG: WD40 repeat domain-containing protein [Nostoc sp.]